MEAEMGYPAGTSQTSKDEIRKAKLSWTETSQDYEGKQELL